MAFTILLSILVIVLSAIPLNIAVKLLGGHSSLLKVIGVNIVVAAVGVLISVQIEKMAGLLSFIALLFIYKLMYDLSWTKALLAWVLQFVVAAILIAILLAFGISLAFL